MATKSTVSWVECVLSRTSRSQIVDGALMEMEYPSHQWTAHLRNGVGKTSPEMSTVLEWVLSNTEDSDHHNTQAIFQRVNELAAKQPDGNNR